mgnify:CR=1 FL=1
MRCLKLAFLLSAFFCLIPARAELVLSSAPRDTKEKEDEIYRPLTDFLTKVAGQKVTFRHGDNFLVYQSEMRKGTYDIIFDGPAFVGWRMTKLEHVPLVKLPGKLVFVLAVKKSQDKTNTLKDLAGRTICAFPSPNLATLTVLDEFDNPARIPMILESKAFPESYRSMVAGKCMGAILQKKLFEDLDKEKQAAKVIFTSKPLPNQAFSAGPKVKPELRAKLVEALLSPEGLAASEKMREVFKAPKLEAASVEEYQGLGRLLRNVWGFVL